MHTARCVAFTLVTLTALTAAADTVVLNNGSKIEGRVVEDTPQQVVLEARGGRLTFPRRIVKEVIRAPLDEPSPKPRPSAEPAPSVKPSPSPTARPSTSGAGQQGWSAWQQFHTLIDGGERCRYVLRYHQLPTELRKLQVAMARGSGFSWAPGIRDHTESAPVRTERIWDITRVGLDAIQFEEYLRGPDGETEHDSEHWDAARWRRQSPLDRKLPTETLTVSGHELTCVIKTKQHGGGKVTERYWVHVDERRRPGPLGVVKRMWGDAVVEQLTEIADRPDWVPPADCGLAIGDRFVFRRLKRTREGGHEEVVYTVRATIPGMVRGVQEGGGYRDFAWGEAVRVDGADPPPRDRADRRRRVSLRRRRRWRHPTPRPRRTPRPLALPGGDQIGRAPQRSDPARADSDRARLTRPAYS